MAVLSLFIALTVVASACGGTGVPVQSLTPVSPVAADLKPSVTLENKGADSGNTGSGAPAPFAVKGDRFTDPEIGPGGGEVGSEVMFTEPSVNTVIDRLGYALVPQTLPRGFALNIAEVLVFPADITAWQVYVPLGDGTASSGALELHITYPMRFTPDGDSFFEAAGFQVPDDVMEPITLGSMEAYLIGGGWDPDSMRILQPYLAVWDYERSLTVMFLHPDTPAGPVWVAVRAELTTLWITVPELIDVAESLIPVE
jgi:hypothetical protein